MNENNETKVVKTEKTSLVGNKLAKLIDVKSIVTLVLTGVLAYLAIIGQITPQDFIKIILLLYGFYFGAQAQKKTTSNV